MDVEHWRIKIKLDELLRQEVDGRTTSGLEKAVLRAEASDNDRIAATLLRNFNKVVKSLKSMAESNLQKIPWSEVEQYMEVVNSEGLALPMSMQHSLLQRRTRELVAECRYKELFQCMNPWEKVSEFDWRRPELSGVQGADSFSKLKTFEKLIVEQVLMDKLYKGEEGRAQVLVLCEEALAQCGSVDVLLLDEKLLKLFRDHLCIWKALTALLGTAWDLTCQEPVSKSGPQLFFSCEHP